jgi:hypothetical protein
MMSRAAQTHLAGRVFETPDLERDKYIFCLLVDVACVSLL